MATMCQICLDLYHLDNRFPGKDPPYPIVNMNLAIEGHLEIAVGHLIFKSSGPTGHWIRILILNHVYDISFCCKLK